MDEPNNDPTNANFVWAPRPQSAVPDWIYLFTHPATIAKWLEMRMNSKFGEYWGLVHGNFPPNPESHVTPARTTGLKRPSGIFQGVKRPLHDGIVSSDTDIIVYVTNPEKNYGLRGTRDGYIITEIPKPDNSVFTTFVTFRPERVESVQKDSIIPVKGIVLGWEWTEASSKDPKLPFEFETRYDGQLL